MTDLSALKAIADAATNSRNEMDDLHREHYAMPNDGAFVGEHTGFMVIEGPTVKALLAVVEAANEIVSPAYIDGTQPGPYCEGVRLDEMRNLMAALAALHDTEGR